MPVPCAGVEGVGLVVERVLMDTRGFYVAVPDIFASLTGGLSWA